MKRQSRTKSIIVWGMTLGILIPALFGFGGKIFHFVKVLVGDDGAKFTLIPLAEYFTVAAGFFFLLLWATMQGMFRDIEKPKYTLLQQEAALERIEDPMGRIPHEG